MNAVTQLPEASMTEVLEQYSDLGNLQRFWPAANGIENSNYFVETLRDGCKHEYVLTILEQDPNALHAYNQMMSHLARSGLPVAPPLPTADAKYSIVIDSKPAILQLRLPGAHAYNPTTKQVCALARFMARMHLAAQRLSLPDYPRHSGWLQAQVQAVQGYIGTDDAQLLDGLSDQITNLLQRQDVTALPSGMIHADLFRDNVLFDPRGLTGVLDFHHASRGVWVYDLAVVANDWCSDSTGALDVERTIAMLRAYHQVRPLGEDELWFFSQFMIYAALAFWLSRLTVTVEQRKGRVARTKNPQEFKRIVQQRLRHTLFVDPRRLEA
ncbi:MAG: homoserine kinase [Pseudomonadota bacterium]